MCILPRSCGKCGTPFTPARYNGLYCSVSCRRTRNRDNHYSRAERYAYHVKWDAAHRNEHNARSMVYRRTHPEQVAELQMKCRHRITRAEHQRMQVEQGNCCALCTRPFQPRRVNLRAAPHTDHDHTCRLHVRSDGGCPECIRGLLCPFCNQTVIPFLEAYPSRQLPHERAYLASRPVARYRAERHLSGHNARSAFEVAY